MPLPNRHRFEFEAIGTRWRIETERQLTVDHRRLVANEIELFDHEWSRFRKDSFITALAKTGGSLEFSHGVPELFGLYDSLFDHTGGCVTPMIGAALSDLGYDASYSFKPQVVRSVPDYRTVLSYSDSTLTLTEPALVDIGAIGKGYLIDRLFSLLAPEYEALTIDGSGDIRTSTAEDVGLEHPQDPTQVIGQIEVAGAAICASATNRRTWGSGLHHIIDPQTCAPVQGITATWAVASDAMTADGLATALFFTDPDVLARQFEFSYVIMFDDGSVRYSPDPRITLYD